MSPINTLLWFISLIFLIIGNGLDQQHLKQNEMFCVWSEHIWSLELIFFKLNY